MALGFEDWWNPVKATQDIFGFGHGADEAEGYLNQIPDMLRKYFDPFISRGERAGAGFEGQINPMATDPTGYLNKLMGQYEPSKGFQMQKEEALRASGNSAAAGGMRGSQLDQEEQAKITNSLMGQDMQQWLQNVLGIQGTGLEGLHSLYGTGFEGARGLSGDLSNVLGSKASLAMQRDAMNQKFFNDLLSGGMQAASMFGGGGFK